MFLPMSLEEAARRGWDELDVIFVTGDAYVDHPAFGVPLLARWLEHHGLRVGIIAQPDWRNKEAFQILGKPRLFFAVSAGAMDSMVAHYTPQKKLRRDDAYTPGNRHGARPNRATIVYTSRLKEAYRDVPVVLGGIEASMRRFAHYDFWDDAVRRSILFDSKADLLVYGMGERPILEIVRRLRDGEVLCDMTDIRGTACVVPRQSDGSVNIPPWDEVSTSRSAFADAFRLLSAEQNPYSGGVVCQRHGDRWLRCNPPALPLTEGEMDAVYALPFSRLPHPSYCEQIPAHEQIRTSITTHRGCFGGCSFCAITHHQGRVIQSRSQRSIVDEVRWIAGQQWFRGSISDLGGPTANMYAVSSANTVSCEVCKRESCLWPNRCPTLSMDDEGAAKMLRAVRGLPGVKHVVVSSGIRYDLLERQPLYFQELVAHHVGGLLKVAPEHTSDSVLQLMRKPGASSFERFMERFCTESIRFHKRQHIVPYLMAAHPGCTISDMADTALFLKRNRLKVEQVQEFTPTPGTLSTCLYHAGIDPWTGKAVKVCRGDRERRMQKELLLWQTTERKKELIALLVEAGRSDAAAELFGHRQCSPPPRRGGKLKKT
jgi:uncharacterized radical SAM protein YgiQ